MANLGQYFSKASVADLQSLRGLPASSVSSFFTSGLTAGARFLSASAMLQSPKVAVLYQAIEPPVIDGTRKPMKPGGYQDSGADIAYNLSQCEGIQVLSPISGPDPVTHEGWSFPDNEDGILSAIEKGATHLWANTILFASHPLQTSSRIGSHSHLRVVGQAPKMVEKYDDKDYVNNLLRRAGRYTMPQAWSLQSGVNPVSDLQDSSFPVVVKPSRGRGSHGVKVCPNATELASHIELLQKESLSSIIIEEFLAGEEATVTVMPPTADRGYWSLPIITRFNHDKGIAPYSGIVAATANSRPVKDSGDPAYAAVAKECEDVARLLGVTAPIRIDVRRFKTGSKFALFDVNMKPNMTGPGRPGRDDQASLTLMAASALGWDYKDLLKNILETSAKLEDLRSLRLPVHISSI